MSDSPENTASNSAKKPKMHDILWQESADLHSGLKGTEVIKQFAQKLPLSPGVYRMLSKDGDVLYVGKAKSLKKRVTSYTKIGGHTQRIARMISETVNMEFIVTRSETEALLLEANLIKRLRPRFNVLMRDDKSFPYIFISTEHDFPRLEKHRGAKTRKGKYYGPFASASAVSRTINALQKVFLLRTCTDREVEAGNRACLNYHMKRCAGPCGGKISKQDYAKLVKQADDFLCGKTTQVQSQLSEQMQLASDEMDFERAAVFRDRLSALAHVRSHQGINPQGIVEADIFAIHQEYGQSCIQVFFFRTGQNWGNRAYFPRHDGSISAQDVLSAFLSQFYDDKPAPRQILLSEPIEEADLLAAALSEKSDYKVSIDVPQRGGKVDVVAHVSQNAREALGRRVSENASQAKLLEGVGQAFGLSETPKRIEIYDNSHISGTNAVGGMVVTGPQGLMKNAYRKFNIKSQDIVPGDDYGMMREVMQRRFSRLVKEHGPRSEQKRDEDGFGPWPDLLLIDGGLGQLNAVLEILDELGLRDDVPAIGIAKGPERDAGREKFFLPGKPAFMLPMRDPVLYFVQRLRDEAHRFAIGSHRARRKKQINANPLDEIEGIGPARKKALLHAFGSAKAVSTASVADLKKVDGVSLPMAQKIHAHFNEQ